MSHERERGESLIEVCMAMLVLGGQAALAIENARLVARLRVAEERLAGENLYLKTRERGRRFADIIGEAPAMKAVMRQLEKVIDNYQGTPVPFGRLKDDAGRIGGIEEGRHNSIAQLMEQVHDEISVTRRYLPTLTDEQWQAVGLHPTRGEIQPPRMVEIFFSHSKM